VYAALNPTNAKEDNSGAQLYEERVVRWMIRTHASVQHDWRVIHNGEEFEIIGILPNGRRTYQTLICKYRDNEQ
jgi:head-tail adaptor